MTLLGVSSPATSAAPATPALVQVKATPSDVQSTGPLISNGAFIVTCFANTTQVNNTVIVRLTTPSTTGNVTSVTDDGSSSNTYTLQKNETAGSETLAIYSAPVVHASRCVTVTFTLGTGATVIGNQVKLYEFDNLSTASGTGSVDVTCSGTATSGTAPACGSSMTPTLSNDLVMTFMDVVSFSSKPATSVTFTAQTGTAPTYSLVDAAGTDWTASQYATNAALSAITPSITVSQAVTRANVVGIAFKAASNGGTYSGVHVNNVTFNAPQYSQSSSFTGTTFVVQFPCFGNDLWVLIGQGASSSTDNTTSIGSDSNSNSWTGLTNVYSSGDGYAVRWWHADSATCNGTEKFTINFTSNPSYMFLLTVDIGNSGGYDSTAGNVTLNSGNSATNPPTTVSGGSITPSTTNGVILSYINQDYDTASAVSTSAAGGIWASDNMSCPNATGGTGCAALGTSGSYYAYSGSGFEQDGGFMVDYYGNSTSSVSTTWTWGTLGNTQNRAIGPYFYSSVVVKHN